MPCRNLPLSLIRFGFILVFTIGGLAYAPALASSIHGQASSAPIRFTARGSGGQVLHFTPAPLPNAVNSPDGVSRPGSSRKAVCSFVGCGPLAYRGGPVVHRLAVYSIYWLPSGYHFEEAYNAGTAPDANDLRYENLINRFFKDAGATSYLNILTQYSDRQAQVPNSLSFGGQWVDTGALNQFQSADTGTFTKPLLDSDIQAEIQRAMKKNSTWPKGGLTAEFFVFTPGGVHSCSSIQLTYCDAEYPAPKNNYCAYHSAASIGGQTVLYSNMFDAGYSTACGGPNWTVNGTHYGSYNGAGPNSDDVADYEISPTSHELSETMTDPKPNSGWLVAGKPEEVGDVCAYVFPTASSTTPHSDVILHGNPYLIQEEWANDGNTCAMSFTRPSILPVNSPADSVPQSGTTPLCSNVPGGDSGSNSSYLLRCAIGDANNDALAGVTSHAISFSGCASPCHIKPSSSLPTITAPLLTMGSAGSAQIDGQHTVPTGLTVSASGVSIRRLRVEYFKQDGVDIGPHATSVSVGNGASGAILGNGRFGVNIGTGPTDAAQALISSIPIYANAKGGIVLAGLAPASCRTGAKAGAPNGYIDCPSITAATRTSVSGTSSCPTCTIEVFAVPATPDASGHGQAQTYLGHATTLANGNWTFTPATALKSGSRVTATVTSPTLGETSEMAANRTVA